MKRSLTDAAVKRLKPPEIGQLDVFDSGFPGLALRLSYGGRRAWTYHYRINGKLKRMTLGTYPALSLSDAREAWRKAKEARDSGRDPAKDKKRQTGATDFESVLAEWLQRDQSGNRSKGEVARLINKDVTPAWRGRSVLDLHRRDVLDVLDAVVDRGSPVTARRLHAHLHRLFRWSVGRGIIPANPMADLPKPGSETKRDRVLSDAELAAVWNAACEMSWPFGPAVQLLILTGARREQIGSLRWSARGAGDTFIEYEDEKPLQIRARQGRNKGGVYTIPLSQPAQAIIEKLPKVASEAGYIFTTNGKTPISGWSKAKAAFPELDPPWRIHDLRRSADTRMNELGVDPHIVEAALGHTQKGIAAVYNRAKYEAAKRAALEVWGQHVMSLSEATRG